MQIQSCHLKRYLATTKVRNMLHLCHCNSLPEEVSENNNSTSSCHLIRHHLEKAALTNNKLLTHNGVR